MRITVTAIVQNEKLGVTVFENWENTHNFGLVSSSVSGPIKLSKISASTTLRLTHLSENMWLACYMSAHSCCRQKTCRFFLASLFFPDLFSIAHSWDILDAAIRRHQTLPATIHQLLQPLTKEWNNFLQATITCLVMSMRRKCNAVTWRSWGTYQLLILSYTVLNWPNFLADKGIHSNLVTSVVFLVLFWISIYSYINDTEASTPFVACFNSTCLGPS